MSWEEVMLRKPILEAAFSCDTVVGVLKDIFERNSESKAATESWGAREITGL